MLYVVPGALWSSLMLTSLAYEGEMGRRLSRVSVLPLGLRNKALLESGFEFEPI